MTTGAASLGDERRLVQRMLAGDERAFGDFFDANFPVLFRFALRRVGGDEDVAEEVVQRTLCAGIDRIATWRGEASLLTWLCAICRRQIVDHHRRLGRTAGQIELDEDLPEVRAALESILTGAPDPEGHALRREMAALVHAALDVLPPHYAEVLEWKYLEDASMKEIASRIGTTAKAVESLLTRARAAYRDALGTLVAARGPQVARGGLHG